MWAFWDIAPPTPVPSSKNAKGLNTWPKWHKACCIAQNKQQKNLFCRERGVVWLFLARLSLLCNCRRFSLRSYYWLTSDTGSALEAACSHWLSCRLSGLFHFFSWLTFNLSCSLENFESKMPFHHPCSFFIQVIIWFLATALPPWFLTVNALRHLW